MGMEKIVFMGIAAVTLLVSAFNFNQNWHKIVITWRGKRLAVLGARGVGKTHILNFLTSGSIPVEYKQTLAPEKYPARRFQLKELDLKFTDTHDVSGADEAYAEWKQLHDKSDIVFYLLRADRLLAGDTNVEARVKNDLLHIGQWLKARESSRPKFFIVGTHCDFDCEFAGLTVNTSGDYLDKFRKLPIMQHLVLLGGGSDKVKVVAGSMKTVQYTEALVYQIFKQVAL